MGRNAGTVVQTTIKQNIKLTGVGLHSGQTVNLTIRPSAAEFGIWFRRVDISTGDNMIAARYDNVNDTLLCTQIGNEAGVQVSTVEHLMAALVGCGVHNALIDVDGLELPILDGSSDMFVRAILKAGIQTLSAPIRAIHVTKRVEVEIDGATAVIEPNENMNISFEIDFIDAAIGQQQKTLNMANGSFVRELCNSRTFCRNADVETMRNNGLALGGSLENAIVVDGAAILNPEGFRHLDECVRHKMLDALGDLGLAGAPIVGHYHGNRAGHAVTNKLLRKLMSDPTAFELRECSPAMAANLPGAGVDHHDLPA
jgi:UDP-3-O-[3-hydroxymyristoyl] N-acetylglucosamine deacetylase